MDPLQTVLTPYEKAWQEVSPSHRVTISERSSKYDSSTSLLYFPTAYESVPVGLKSEELPSDDWIMKSVDAFVLGEFGTGSQTGGGGELIEQVGELEYGDTDLLQLARLYLKNCEKELVFSGLSAGIRDNAGPGMSAQVHKVISDPTLGNKMNSKYLEYGAFAHKVAPILSKKGSLLFILPALPFKDQNIFRTDCPASHVDMIDIAFIVRLHALSLAMYPIEPYGAEWIILSDGTAYAEMLGVRGEDALSYKAKLMQFRNELNLQYTVSILDLRHIACNILGPESGPGLFQRATRHISQRLGSLHSQEPIRERFRVLVRGMKWNRNWKSFFQKHNVGWDEAWQLLRVETPDKIADANLRKTWEDLDAIAVETAREYAAFNLAIKYFSIYETFFPSALKATTHPKDNQVAVPSMGEVTPWNGVCLARDLRCSPTSFESVPLYKLMRKGGMVKCYRDRGSSYPAFYCREERS